MRARDIVMRTVRLLFDGLNQVFYFSPILLANHRFRKSLLEPLYEREWSSSRQKKNYGRMVIYMALPETTFCGGLSDRLRGIVSIYAECKRRGLPFRIVFKPLQLEEYLAPNDYDWRIADDDICWDWKKVYACVLLTYHFSSRNRWQHFVQSTVLRSFLRKPYGQIHVFSNMICKDSEYSLLFHELFKPSPELEKLIEYNLEKLGGKGSYISLTFRFRQLLGDFKEGGSTLPDAQRMPYIERCLGCVAQLHEAHPEYRILVTSDSHTFLDTLSKKAADYVYVMPGRVVHMGFTAGAAKETYMKSFLDMYMLSYAHVVYQAVDRLLFRSTFPIRSALLGGTAYREIRVGKKK